MRAGSPLLSLAFSASAPQPHLAELFLGASGDQLLWIRTAQKWLLSWDERWWLGEWRQVLTECGWARELGVRLVAAGHLMDLYTELESESCAADYAAHPGEGCCQSLYIPE